jgi:hypothetical protein
MTMGMRRNKTPWIYRPVRQPSPRANRIMLTIWLSTTAIISVSLCVLAVSQWTDIPGAAIPGLFLVAFCGVYAALGLVMLAINKNVFD